MIISDINLNPQAFADGITTALVGYAIVFIALVLLYFVFMLIPKIMKIQIRKRLAKKGEVVAEGTEQVVTGELNAAISAALFLYFDELHDDESTELTIKKVSKNYSPWSSKIYSMGGLLNR